MKIINDTEVFEPSECYFAISNVTDATWSSNAYVEDVKATMLRLGFVESEEMKIALERE